MFQNLVSVENILCYGSSEGNSITVGYEEISVLRAFKKSIYIFIAYYLLKGFKKPFR